MERGARGAHDATARRALSRQASIGRLASRWWLAALVAGLAIGGWHPGERHAISSAFEGRLLDLRHTLRGPIQPSPEFAIVAIDDKTLTRLRRFPVPRSELADGIERLAAAGAKAIAVDLLLLEREAASGGVALSDGDAALVQALSRTDRVVLASALAARAAAATTPLDMALIARNGFAVVESAAAGGSRPSRAVHLLLPVDEFARVAGLAHVNAQRDADGAMRRIALALRAGDAGFLPAMPLDAVRRLRELPRASLRLEVGVAVQLGETHIPTDAESAIAINYYGAQGSFETHSLIDVLDGRVAGERLAGRAVFIGATAAGLGDVFASPFSEQLPGVEALVSAAANIAEGRFLRRDAVTHAIDALLCGSLGVFAFFAANRRSLLLAGTASAALWLVCALAVQFAFVRGPIWLDATSLIVALAGTGLASFVARIAQQRRISGRLQRERDNLARYQSPLLSDWLAEQERPRFSGRAQTASVMFVDVAGFTRRSEQLGPAASVVFLRELHARIETAALAHGGVIEQFMGDGAMIIFGLPQPAADDAARALAAARRLLDEMSAWNTRLQVRGEAPVGVRIGLHCGPVVAALLGGERQGHVTVTGDTVNVASRLQEMGKTHGATIVGSDAFVASVRESAGDAPLAGMRHLADQPVRGRDQPIDVWVWPAAESTNQQRADA